VTNRGLGEFPGPGPDGLIDILPCTGCGEETASLREVEHRGAVVMWAYRCRPCRAKDDAEAAQQRARFDGLLAAGVSEETTSAVLDRWFCRRT